MITVVINTHKPDYSNIEDLSQHFDDLGDLLNENGYDAGEIKHIKPSYEGVTCSIQADPNLIRKMLDNRTVELRNSKVCATLELEEQAINWQHHHLAATSRVEHFTQEQLTNIAIDYLIDRYKNDIKSYYRDLLFLEKQK